MIQPMPDPDLQLYVTPLTSERLEEFAAFSCGSEEWQKELDAFLRENALEEGLYRLNFTYVFYGTDRQPVGYTTLLASQVQNAQRKSPPLIGETRYSYIPVLLVGRLAIAQEHQSHGYGALILAWIKDMARRLEVGCRFVALHCDERNEAGIHFYESHGFITPPLPARQQRLMLFDLLDGTADNANDQVQGAEGE